MFNLFNLKRFKMKYLIFSILAIFSLSGYSQTSGHLSWLDSLNTTSSTDAVTRTTDRLESPFLVEVHVLIDSLSGGTTGTLYIQHAPAGTDRWQTLSTTVIDGATQQAVFYEDSFLDGRVRVYATAGSSTQSTKIRTDIIRRLRKSW